MVSARNGSEAIAKALEHLPDAIVLDVNLPDVNGFDVCRSLKTRERTCRIAIIFHSATDDSAEARLEAKAAGGAAFLSYPMHYQGLISMLKACLAPVLWPKEGERFNFDSESRVGQ